MIHNLKMVCPQGHVFAAVAWNDEHHTQADAADYLDLGAAVVAKGGPPVCEACGAIAFTLDDEVTDYRSMAEAMPALAAKAIEDMESRQDYTRAADRN